MLVLSFRQKVCHETVKSIYADIAPKLNFSATYKDGAPYVQIEFEKKSAYMDQKQKEILVAMGKDEDFLIGELTENEGYEFFSKIVEASQEYDALYLNKDND